MLQLVLYGLLAVIVAAGLFLLASRFLPAGEQIAPPLRDEVPWELPAQRMLHPDEVDAVRLPVALRGYRFAETDLLLDRLAGELRLRDQEIARLSGYATPVDPDDNEPYVPSPLDPTAFRPPSEQGSERAEFGKPETLDEAVAARSWAPPPVPPPLPDAHAATGPQPPPSDDDEQPIEQPGDTPIEHPDAQPVEDRADGGR